MGFRHILHMITPLKHASPFDANMAVDAGFEAVFTYSGVELAEVPSLVQDAIFSRGPKGAKATGIFIAGRNAELALDMLEAARKAMVPPFAVSVLADPAGSFTTAAAMLAKVEQHLARLGRGGLQGKKVAILGGTGVVGFAAGVIAAGEGAETVLVGYDGPERVQRLAAQAGRRFGVNVTGADGSNEAKKETLLEGVEVVLAAARVGVRVLSAAQLEAIETLAVAADVNAVPPTGIEGIGVQDDGVPFGSQGAVGIGALAIGVIKLRIEAKLLHQMIESDTPLFLDFRDAFRLARTLVA